MLILTRRVGETVMIGSDVTVTVLGVKGNQVRVGVNAPRDVAVHREEIFERIKREEQARPFRPSQGQRRQRRRTASADIPGGPSPARPPQFPVQARSGFTPAGARSILARSLDPAGEMAEWSKAHPC